MVIPADKWQAWRVAFYIMLPRGLTTRSCANVCAICLPNVAASAIDGWVIFWRVTALHPTTRAIADLQGRGPEKCAHEVAGNGRWGRGCR